MNQDLSIYVLNQLFDLEKKVKKMEDGSSLQRHIDRIRRRMETEGLTVEDPQGQAYNETRTDCEASIAGESAEELVITEVIKPIIRFNRDGDNQIIQKAVVIAEKV